MNTPHTLDRSITVVIPTYNRCFELARALDSLVAQTDADFDVIVCDDGSTEDIAAITQDYTDRLRLQLLRIDNSGGPARPRNVAVAAAHTSWVSFLDSDDWWAPQRMARVRASLVNGIDIVYHQLTVHRANACPGEKPSHGSLLGNPLRSADPLLHMIRFGNPLPTSATTVRRELMMEIGGFDESRDLASVEDFDAWLRLASRGAIMLLIPEPLGWYWVGSDQISTFGLRQYERQANLFNRQLELLPPAYRARARSNFSYLLGSYALDLELPGADEHFQHIVLTQEPWRWAKARVKQWRARHRPSASK
jgi:glycosyltransferase involved in cell wall biosynthesis